MTLADVAAAVELKAEMITRNATTLSSFVFTFTD
jgi:hypothetical protein